MTTRRDPESLLPLTPAMFHILVALADGASARLRDYERRRAAHHRRRPTQHRHALRHHQAAPADGLSARSSLVERRRAAPSYELTRVSDARSPAPKPRASSRRSPSRAERPFSDMSSRLDPIALPGAAAPLPCRVPRRLRRRHGRDVPRPATRRAGARRHPRGARAVVGHHPRRPDARRRGSTPICCAATCATRSAICAAIRPSRSWPCSRWRSASARTPPCSRS